jgi:hypothetical protein
LIIRIIGATVVVCIGILIILASNNASPPFSLTVAWTGPSQHVATGSAVILDARGSDLVENGLVEESDRIDCLWRFTSKPEDSTTSFGETIVRKGLIQDFISDIDGPDQVVTTGTPAELDASDTA